LLVVVTSGRKPILKNGSLRNSVANVVTIFAPFQRVSAPNWQAYILYQIRMVFAQLSFFDDSLCHKSCLG
jgi:hypothetical protein